MYVEKYLTQVIVIKCLLATVVCCAELLFKFEVELNLIEIQTFI